MGNRWRRALMQGEGVPPTLPYTFPRTRMAGYQFDGENNYIDCGKDSSLNITDEITVEAWVKPNTFANEGHDRWLVVKRNDTWDDNGYALFFGWTDEIYFTITDIDSHTKYEMPETFLKTWSHIVGTFDGSNMKLYINGVKVSEQSATHGLVANNEPIYVGGNGVKSHNGLISSVSIYKNQALSPSAIRKLYEGRKLPTDFDGCVLYLPLYEHHTHDRSGYGNHGTNYGARYVEAIA
ncbi:MAG: LamG domain-containing protein [Methermicoccaceae archaeon]